MFGEKSLNTAFNYDTATVNAFTDAAATLPYTSGTPVATIYIKPTVTQLENVTFNIPVSTTLTNGCIANGSVTVTNNTKIFVAGTTGSDWNTATNWKPNGVPTANNCVVIFDNDVNITGANYTAYGQSLTVKPTGNLNIESANTTIITDFVNVETGGVLEYENDASLVQINNVINTGKINYKRNATGIRGFDYVYWSSPVANQDMNSIYSSPVSGPKYIWNTTITNGNAGQGNWVSTSGSMQPAKGYIIRGSSNYGMPATNIATNFTGVPNNGNISVTIARGTYTGVPYNGTNGIQITNLDDNFNLIGNPYPSAIDAVAFLALNSGVIHGNVNLWRHGSQPSTIINPFYGSYLYNYNSDDYITINSLGASDPTFLNPIIKSGQAFLVQMLDGSATTGTVNFTNSLRLKTGVPLNNGGFFRNSNNTNNETTEKHRIWLDLIDQNNVASGTLVGYSAGASDAFDSAFDSPSGIPNYMKLYSLIDSKVYTIQGKSLPFMNTDEVPLGITTTQNGNYTIGINAIDGLFANSNQEIYLEDKSTGQLHDLKTAPYAFTSAAGTFHNRFVLKYTNQTLHNNNYALDAANVFVISTENLIVKSKTETIKSVRVFDLLGRELANVKNINALEVNLDNIQQNNAGLLLQITLTNEVVVNKKVMY